MRRKDIPNMIFCLGSPGACARVAVALALALLPGLTSAQEWREITPVEGPAPSPRFNATGIYDREHHRVVIYGGRGSGGAVGDVWAFELDSNSWEELTPFEGPAPAPRFTPAGVYDEAGGQMVMWSGQGSAFFNDVWAFDLSDHAWTDLSPDMAPNIRYGVAAVFDPMNRSLVTFAGFTDEGRFDDTWVFDVQQQTWLEVTPAEGPMRRCLHTASYDHMRRRMIMYGGQRSGAIDDIWAFDLDERSWTDLTGEGRPEGRYFAASVYDTINDRMLVFGGNRGGGSLSDELWAFESAGNTWQLLMPSGQGPSAREGAVAVFVESEDRVIVFGGRGPSHLNDVWSLDLQSSPTATRPDGVPVGLAIRLYPNYPNPVSSTTTIEYEVDEPTKIFLAIFDLRGRKIRRLVGGVHNPGRHTIAWDGIGPTGRRVSPGVYLYQLRGGGHVQSRRMVVH